MINKTDDENHADDKGRDDVNDDARGGDYQNAEDDSENVFKGRQ